MTLIYQHSYKFSNLYKNTQEWNELHIYTRYLEYLCTINQITFKCQVVQTLCSMMCKHCAQWCANTVLNDVQTLCSMMCKHCANSIKNLQVTVYQARWYLSALNLSLAESLEKWVSHAVLGWNHLALEGGLYTVTWLWQTLISSVQQ